jgi:hypothetical protein
MKQIISRPRIIQATLVVVTALSLTAARLAAQVPGSAIVFRPVVGAFLPTGTQRDMLKSAVLVGGQLGVEISQNFAVTGSFGWAPSKDRTLVSIATTPLDQTLDVFQYDLGLEARLPITAGLFEATPYAGAGAGGRSYNYRTLTAPSQTNVSGYGALGLDIVPLGSGIGLRLEARDNISKFTGLQGELTKGTRRNDVAITTGLTWRF